MVNIAIVYHTRFGHTKVVAEAVQRGAAAVAGTHVDLIFVDELPPPDDKKHYGGKWPVLDAAHAIIFGSPTYMGSVSAGLKQFMESSSSLWLKLAWKDKIAAGFTNSGSWSGDKLNTLMDMAIFAAQHGMIWVGLGMLPGFNTSKSSIEDLNRIGAWMGAMSQSNLDQGPDKVPPVSDQKTAEALGRRVAEATKRWNGQEKPG